jgi:hypothetical protein
LIAHWLAVNGKQPTINENPIIEIPIQSNIRSISHKKSNKISHILSTVNQRLYSNNSLMNYSLCLGTTNLLQRINRDVYLFK